MAPSTDRAALSGLAILVLLGGTALAASACGEDDPPAQPAELAAAHVSDPPPTPPTSDAGGGGFVIEVDCPVGTAVELEDNDTAEKANAFEELSFCGAISPGSDVDYSTFKTPDGKKLTLFQGVIEGQVDFDLIVNGKTLRPSEVKNFEAGEYLVKAYTKDGKPGKYRYRIQFEP